MLIRVRGGRGGIKEYLEEGRKDGRGYSRNELDERIILSGDLRLTNDVIKNMDKEGERYLHITLSFKEDHIDRENLRQITDEFEEFAMSAYADDEYNFYAEAHLPKLKSYTDGKTGEFIERKSHIHVVIPEHNLLSERNLNPFGKVDQQTKFLEAFQEHINDKYGLASPKDNQRTEFTDESTIIDRYGGNVFKGANQELKERLFSDVMAQNIHDFDRFQALAKEYGEIRTRKGREGDYLNVKPSGARKGINLKEYVFSREFIELPGPEKQAQLRGELQRHYEEAQPTRPTPADLTTRLQEWHVMRAREIKYINSGNQKLYKAYRDANPEQRQIVLNERATAFYTKHRDSNYDQINLRARQRPEERDTQLRRYLRESYNLALTERPEAKTLNGLRNLSSRSLAHAAQGTKVLLPSNARISLEREGTEPIDRLRRPRNGNRADVGRSGRKITGSDTVVGQYAAELRERERRQTDPRREELDRIKRELDGRRLLTAVGHSHGVLTEKYEITKGRDGSDRIRCGERNLNVSDFLTQELRLPWREAVPILQQTYAEQQQQEPVQARRTPDQTLWADYRQRWQPQQRERREQDWQEQREHEQTRRVEARRVYQAQRRTIQNDRGRKSVERKAALSLIRMEKVQADLALREQIQAEREVLKARYGLRPAEQYRAYLAERSEQGDTDALAELRRQQVRAPLPVGEYIEHREPGQEGKHLIQPIIHTVDRAGNVTYYDNQHHAIFVDTGRAVEFAQTEAEHEALEKGLRLALAKFGTSLRLNGTDEYQQQLVDLAADVGLRHIDFNDEVLNERYRERIDAIQAGREYIAHPTGRLGPESQQQEQPSRPVEPAQRGDRTQGTDVSR